MKNKTHTGILHFDYHFYYKIMRYTKSEIGELLVIAENKLSELENNKDCDGYIEKLYNLRREYNLILERYNELV